MFLSVFRSNEVDDEDGDYKPVCSLREKNMEQGLNCAVLERKKNKTHDLL